MTQTCIVLLKQIQTQVLKIIKDCSENRRNLALSEFIGIIKRMPTVFWYWWFCQLITSFICGFCLQHGRIQKPEWTISVDWKLTNRKLSLTSICERPSSSQSFPIHFQFRTVCSKCMAVAYGAFLPWYHLKRLMWDVLRTFWAKIISKESSKILASKAIRYVRFWIDIEASFYDCTFQKLIERLLCSGECAKQILNLALYWVEKG